MGSSVDLDQQQQQPSAEMNNNNLAQGRDNYRNDAGVQTEGKWNDGA
jgi:hypothetical protein